MEEWIPEHVRLGQLLVESPDGPPRLEFFLEIDFCEGEFDGETGAPFLRISHFRPPGKSWRSLAGQVWGGDGGNDVSGLDASMLLFRASNPVEVERLELGEVRDDGTIAVELSMAVDFEMEAYRDNLGVVPVSLGALTATIGPLRISTRLEKHSRGDEAMIREAVDSVVDLNDYGPLEQVPGGYGFPGAF